jgi:transcriptional regulator with XRE-family HTH domain
MGRQNATARFRELGAELRNCRKDAGVTGKQLAHRTGWNASKVSRIESGHDEIGEIELLQYLGVCKVYLAQAHEYLKLCREANHYRDYWLASAPEHLGDAIAALTFQESAANLSTTCEPQIVPGLLQTEGYARAMISRETWRTPDSIEFGVRARMERQQVLRRPKPVRFDFFVREEALRLEVGSAAIMHEQLLKLTIVSGLPSVGLRVVPASAGVAAVFGGSFRVLLYAEHQPLVCLDTYVGGLFVENQEHVAAYRRLVPSIREYALDEGQSREFVATLASEYDDRGNAQPDVRVEEKRRPR